MECYMPLACFFTYVCGLQMEFEGLSPLGWRDRIHHVRGGSARREPPKPDAHRGRDEYGPIGINLRTVELGGRQELVGVGSLLARVEGTAALHRLRRPLDHGL